MPKLADLCPHRRFARVALAGAAMLCGALACASGVALASDHIGPPRLDERQQAYHAELVGRAAEKRLWEQRYWQVLLHYRKNRILPGVRSEADGSGFFNAPHGKVDPREELEWTLARFFTSDMLEPGKMTTQCTFPGRYRWLNEQLGFDPARLPEQDCPRFQRWRSSLDPGSVTLIYASYYFNVPASMFGHTLLRYDKKARPEDERLLDYGVNYAAYTDPNDSDLMYGVKGLLGGYRGRFSLLPYYIKVREYNDVENRDLWEYRLNLTQEQIDRMLLHTWEMGSTDFDYFFLEENCSYHLLSLLEAGNPDLHLTDQFGAYVLPFDTVRVVLKEAGLVESVRYRPSRSAQLEHKLSFLSADERTFTLDLVRDLNLLDSPALAALPLRNKALILESAADYLQTEIADSRGEDPVPRANLRRVLLARSKLNTVLDDLGEPPRPVAPETGHESTRLEIAVGANRNDRGFVDLTLQPAMHDLLAEETGYPPNSNVEAFTGQVRIEQVRVPRGPDNPTDDPDQTEAKVRLEKYHIARVISLFPWTALERTFSWRFRVGWERTHEGGLPCEPCTPFVLDGGGGIALQADVPTRIVTFSMLEPVLQVGSMFDDGYRFGVGLSLGILMDLGSRWRVGLFGRSTEFFAGEREGRNVGQATLTQRITLSRNVDLRLDWSGIEDHREGRIALGFYY